VIHAWPQKKPASQTEDGLSKSCLPRAGLGALFGGPAIRTLRTRGFASPDYSGFAIIGELIVKNYSNSILLEKFCRTESYAKQTVIDWSLAPYAFLNSNIHTNCLTGPEPLPTNPF